MVASSNASIVNAPTRTPASGNGTSLNSGSKTSEVQLREDAKVAEFPEGTPLGGAWIAVANVNTMTTDLRVAANVGDARSRVRRTHVERLQMSEQKRR
jgi:hypothetical protein